MGTYVLMGVFLKDDVKSTTGKDFKSCMSGFVNIVKVKYLIFYTELQDSASTVEPVLEEKDYNK